MKAFTIRKSGDRWVATMATRNGVFEAKYRSFDDAAWAVGQAIDTGLFLGYRK